MQSRWLEPEVKQNLNEKTNAASQTESEEGNWKIASRCRESWNNFHQLSALKDHTSFIDNPIINQSSRSREASLQYKSQ